MLQHTRPRVIEPGWNFFWKVWEMQKKGSTPAAWQKLEHLGVPVGRCHVTKEANSPISPLRTSADGVGAEARPRCRCTVQWGPKNGVLELSMKAEIPFQRQVAWIGVDVPSDALSIFFDGSAEEEEVGLL